MKLWVHVLCTPNPTDLDFGDLDFKKKILVFNNVKILDKSGPLPLSKIILCAFQLPLMAATLSFSRGFRKSPAFGFVRP